ncbi:MAG: DNA polymerase III subunit delta [Proteobacteria bacterium]|nr:DNA polymerase III subunit delta [Pseudomonadota bacterium]
MNVRPDQLPAMIDKQVYPVYLVSGDEPLQQMESLDVIRAFLRGQEYSEREVLDVDAQFDWYRLMEEAASMSLFSTRRIVELRLPSAKPGRQGSQVIKDYLSRPPEDTVLIINAGKVDGNSKKSAWFKSVEQAGLIVQCWPVTIDKLAPWLQQRFRKRDMEADAEVLAYISEHVEGNLLAADQEIEKLYMLLGPGKVTYADVAEAITSQSRYSVFELIDMLHTGDVKRVVKIIAGLKAEGLVPVLIVSLLAKDIRLLCQVAKDPASAAFTLKRSGVWQSRVDDYRKCLSRHREQTFQLLLKRCAYIDAASKGMIDANVWDEIESVCVRLAGRSKR